MNRITPLLFAGVRSRVLTGLPAVPTQAAGSGTWTLTGSMHVAREDFTAMLLQNGQVLVVGSESANAELYNPSTGKWATTGSLHTPRIERTDTLLPNGRVLAVGGLDSNYNYLDSTEFYTP